MKVGDIMIHDSKCIYCSNYLKIINNFIPTCKAFPEGIPEQIFWGTVDHTKPYPGDNGIRFEKKED